MATIVVKDTAGLTAALKSAQDGDTIKLAAGDYAGFTVSNVKFGGAGVTVTALDPAKETALTSFELRGCEGIKFQDLDFKADPTKVNPFQILNSSRITLDRLDVHGSLDGNAHNDSGGLLIRESSDVKVTNSEFHQLQYGVAHVDAERVTIAGNKFHEIQEDGVRGGGTSHIDISNNVFTNFAPKGLDHPDAIQFWTKNTTASATDITISGNLIIRGEGAAIQGVFFRDQVGNLPYKDVVVSDNLVIGGMANGIMVTGVNGAQISNNVVAGLPGQSSGIGLDAATNVVLNDNQASQYSIAKSVTALTNTDSAVLAPVTDGGANLVKAFVGDNPEILDMLSSAKLMTLVNDALAKIEALRLNTKFVTGTSGNDQLRTATDRDTVIEAGAGNDMLDSVGVGHNRLIGGAGDDVYRLSSKFDAVVEETDGGYDHVMASVDVTLSNNVEKLTITGSVGRVGTGNALGNSMAGGTGGDTLSGEGGDDKIQSVDGNDRVLGGAGADTVYGGNGNDTLSGDDGADSLRGDAGDDSLSGGAGIDRLDGNGGADTLAGGAGADQFVYSSLETAGEVIFDFSRADGDKINLSAVDANTVLANNQAFAFIGTGAFTKVAGQLRYEISGSDSYVMGDLNGDGAADFKLLMKNITSLQSSDFLL